MEETKPKLNGQNLDDSKLESFTEGEFPNTDYAFCLAANVTVLHQAMKTPFLFVVAVNPQDGSFEYCVKSSKPRVSEILMKHFQAVWNDKVVPEVNAAEPKIVTPKGPLIIVPGGTHER
jgi:hypothetical protein